MHIQLQPHLELYDKDQVEKAETWGHFSPSGRWSGTAVTALEILPLFLYTHKKKQFSYKKNPVTLISASPGPA